MAACQAGDSAGSSSSSSRCLRPTALRDVAALGFPLSQQGTMSRERDVSVGSRGLGFFSGDGAAAGTRHCTALEAEIKHGVAKTA